MITPLNKTGIALPWETRRLFQVWRYGVGHSQLVLRSVADGENMAINVLFEAVEFMRLRRSYPDALLRLATPEEHVLFGELPPRRLLRFVIASPAGVGLVACSRVTVRETELPDDDMGYDGSVLMHMIANSS